ncbi:MFS transporter [Streptomyces sp. NPDC096012]|uniref:MFS transporter n=1 Tax=Streptomyces sp. NPDC096012 TaxID=3155684 RepID=UPI00336A2833
MPAPTPLSFQRAKWSIAALFCFLGFQYGTWVSRIPALKSRLDLGAGEVGLLLMACGAGAAASFPLVAALTRRIGSRRLSLLSALALVAVLAALSAAPNYPLALITVCADGVAVGCLNVAMNAQGAALEKAYDRTAMSQLHATFSAGLLAAALLTSGVTTATASVPAHFTVAGALLLLLLLGSRTGLLPGGATPPATRDTPDTAPARSGSDVTSIPSTPDATPARSTPDTTPAGSTPDATPVGSTPDATPAGSTPDATPATARGTLDAQPAAALDTLGAQPAAALDTLDAQPAALDTADAPPAAPGTPRRGRLALPSGATLLMGCAMAFGTITEGAMNDWSTLYMKDVVKASAAVAPLGIAVVSVMMLLARVFADRWRTRWGDGRVVRTGSAVAAVGLALALLAGGIVPTLLGFACVGLGAAAVTPCVYVAAAGQGSDALALVAAMGTTGLLGGPALIGFVAGAANLTVGMATVAAAALVVTLTALRIPWPTRSPSPVNGVPVAAGEGA